MKEVEISAERNSAIIDGITLGFTIALLLAAAAGTVYTDTSPSYLFRAFLRILLTPGPLVTDYFMIGSMPAAFLNAGLCGLTMCVFMAALPGSSHVNTLAGFFLVIAHAFYGLNFLNMWPCFLAPFLYLKLKKLDFSQNLHVCMFATCFSPFVSEMLFRYTLGDRFVPGEVHVTLKGVLLTLNFMLVLAFVAPAILPGAKAWHKGYLLYNGGLAYGMFAFLVYNFMYRTVGVQAPTVPVHANMVYERFGRSYAVFGDAFFLLVFGICFLVGWYLNGKRFRGLELLLLDTGYQSNFARKYGMPLCLINIGIYGTMFLFYINMVIGYTEGAGFTGPTFGVILASLTFTAMGQHPGNVWPIFVGFPLLSLISTAFNYLIAGHVVWTVSSQAYINSVAFATGLCPIVGRYGALAGIAAGALCASLCTATGALHGGLMLYNGGFTAGIAALILLPMLEHYFKKPRENMSQHIDLLDMMTLREVPEKGEKPE